MKVKELVEKLLEHNQEANIHTSVLCNLELGSSIFTLDGINSSFNGDKIFLLCTLKKENKMENIKLEFEISLEKITVLLNIFKYFRTSLALSDFSEQGDSIEIFDDFFDKIEDQIEEQKTTSIEFTQQEIKQIVTQYNLPEEIRKKFTEKLKGESQ